MRKEWLRGVFVDVGLTLGLDGVRWTGRIGFRGETLRDGTVLSLYNCVELIWGGIINSLNSVVLVLG